MLANIIKSERKAFEKCHDNDMSKIEKCAKDVEKCTMSEACMQAHFKKKYPKCYEDPRCENNVRLCLHDLNCRGNIEMCLSDASFCNFKVKKPSFKDSVSKISKRARVAMAKAGKQAEKK